MTVSKLGLHTLGIVLAGGRSSRFGSDKAQAELHGQSLLEHAIAQLSGWCDEVVVIGREDAPVTVAPDWPKADCGPLGGIAGGLRYAQAHGFTESLSMGVDSLGLPDALPQLLSPAPAYLASQPVIGAWPTAALPQLEAILLGSGKHSMRRFVEAISARPVTLEHAPANINRPEDLARLLKEQ